MLQLRKHAFKRIENELALIRAKMKYKKKQLSLVLDFDNTGGPLQFPGTAVPPSGQTRLQLRTQATEAPS